MSRSSNFILDGSRQKKNNNSYNLNPHPSTSRLICKLWKKTTPVKFAAHLLNIVLLYRLRGAVHSILLHVLAHIGVLDDCFAVRHFCFLVRTRPANIRELAAVLHTSGVERLGLSQKKDMTEGHLLKCSLKSFTLTVAWAMSSAITLAQPCSSFINTWDFVKAKHAILM